MRAEDVQVPNMGTAGMMTEPSTYGRLLVS